MKKRKEKKNLKGLMNDIESYFRESRIEDIDEPMRLYSNIDHTSRYYIQQAIKANY